MTAILNFLADYYILFIIVSVVLLIALIGFIAGERKKNKSGVQTASATDLPINNAEVNVEPTAAPQVPIAPAEPVMATAPQESVPVEESLTPAEEAAMAPTLVIDEPTSEVVTEVTPEVVPVQEPAPVVVEPAPVDQVVVPTTPVENALPDGVALTPAEEAAIAPTLVIDEPTPGVITSEIVSESSLQPETPVIDPNIDNSSMLAPSAPVVETPVLEPAQPSVFDNIETTDTGSIFENNQNN